MNKKLLLFIILCSVLLTNCKPKAAPLEPITPNNGTKQVVFRFAVASDTHFGTDIVGDSPDGNIQNVANFVGWMNQEATNNRLDCLFINGDATMNPRVGWPGPGMNYPIDQGGYIESNYLNLKSRFLDNLLRPVFLNKGNHDYTDPVTNNPFQTWKGICSSYYQNYTSYSVAWGAPIYKTGNHTIISSNGKYAWIMADSTVYGESEQYDYVDVDWLEQELDRLHDKQTVFILSHIAQKSRTDGWPGGGVNNSDAMAIIGSYDNVKAIFHGHMHFETGEYTDGGKHFFFDSHVGSQGNKKGYRIVEIHDDGSIRTYQVNAEEKIIMNSTNID